MRWKLAATGILIESKDEIRKRLGRSPDRGDALAMSWATGVDRDAGYVPAGLLPASANVGYASAKARYGSIRTSRWRQAADAAGLGQIPERSQADIVAEFAAAQTRSASRPRPWRR